MIIRAQRKLAALSLLQRLLANVDNRNKLGIRMKMFRTLSYYWSAARGYRFKPWKSPYMCWRFETFLGKEAADMTPRKFFHLAWKYREHMERFVDWAAERRRFQRRHV
jgi:hypothetical protein